MHTIKIGFTILLCIACWACQSPEGDYVCKPCNLPCDELSFKAPGICPHCKMPLILKTDLLAEANLKVNEIEIKIGSGVFLIEGGKGKEEKSIKVYYHQPKQFTPDSRILLVIPGAGRNADSYRDSWVEASEQYNVLILSPQYLEADYPFEAYHLGGLIKNVNLSDAISFVEGTNQAKLNEEIFEYDVNQDSTNWLFNDFDRLFDRVVEATQSTQVSYDIFGHSAGGQILHRFVLFQTNSKAHRILAGNSGFYTLPTFDTPLPFGLRNSNLSVAHQEKAFQKELTLFIGALDNQDEQGGTLLRSPTVDKQGLHRLARGKYFYLVGQREASKLGLNFNWKLEIIPEVGHEQGKMAAAAAEYLYK